MTDTRCKIADRNLNEWMEFARRDDCLDMMVPSDLRAILSYCSMMELHVFSLYKALDDIDTASDIAKDDDQLYRALVRMSHQQRHNLPIAPMIAELYAKYYKSEA